MDTTYRVIEMSLICVCALGAMALNLTKAALFLTEEHDLAVRQTDPACKSMLVYFSEGTSTEWIDLLNRTGQFIAGPWELFPEGPKA